MTLTLGQTVHGETTGQSLTVRKLLGAGGQGAVYLVDGRESPMALKWYNEQMATSDQKDTIRYLVRKGPPEKARHRFVWPVDLVVAPNTNQFGYVMPLIDRKRFVEFLQVEQKKVRGPARDVLCEISYQIANSYRFLHLSGHCYRDISKNNVMFDPLTGDVLIFDNDNVGVNGVSKCSVYGTSGYIAPELIRRETKMPSIQTDLHSLAVLLFQFWTWHHPLHGQMEYNIHCWDLPAQIKIYGTSPVFIFHPTDTRNRLPQAYKRAAEMWDMCPKSLKRLFTRAFTTGLESPEGRVTDVEWQNLFWQLKDGALACPRCGAISLWESAMSEIVCWNPECKRAIDIPPRLVFRTEPAKKFLVLTETAKILQRHIERDAMEGGKIVGDVSKNPNQPSILGLRNLCETPWVAKVPDRPEKYVNPTRSIAISPGLRLNIQGVETEVIA